MINVLILVPEDYSLSRFKLLFTGVFIYYTELPDLAREILFYFR
jgi:hypothetical protein